MSSGFSPSISENVFLNLHHLRYFREVAREGNLTRAAVRLRLSGGALSSQIKQLEQTLGHSLFNRSKSGMSVTEAGRLVLEYAEVIHRAGSEMMDVLKNQPIEGRTILRIGAVATLSRNFFIEFLRPALKQTNVSLVVRSGSLHELVRAMQSHQVDVILSNHSLRRDSDTLWHSHLLARHPVSLVGSANWKKRRIRFPEGINKVPLILPSFESSVRMEFERILALEGLRPLVLAEVDDMPMLRLLAREADALALVAPVVVRDELDRGELREIHRVAGLWENFYAVAPTRRFPNPLVGRLVQTISKRKKR